MYAGRPVPSGKTSQTGLKLSLVKVVVVGASIPSLTRKVLQDRSDTNEIFYHILMKCIKTEYTSPVSNTHEERENTALHKGCTFDEDC